MPVAFFMGREAPGWRCGPFVVVGPASFVDGPLCSAAMRPAAGDVSLAPFAAARFSGRRLRRLVGFLFGRGSPVPRKAGTGAAELCWKNKDPSSTKPCRQKLDSTCGTCGTGTAAGSPVLQVTSIRVLCVPPSCGCRASPEAGLSLCLPPRFAESFTA